MRYVINLATLLLIITPLKANLHTVTEAPFVVPTKCNETELKLLAKLIYSESPHEPYLGKLAVGNVVINRMSRTGKSMKKIIFQKGQFDGVRSKRFKRVQKGDEQAFKECVNAAKEILEGRIVLLNTYEFFHNPKTSTDSKWVRKISKSKCIKIGRHVFCQRPA